MLHIKLINTGSKNFCLGTVEQKKKEFSFSITKNYCDLTGVFSTEIKWRGDIPENLKDVEKKIIYIFSN
jgi:hypothetical protein